MSDSFNIAPVWTSIILTGELKIFSILCTVPTGTKVDSSTVLKKLFLLSVILGLPFVTSQCSDL